MTPEQRIVGYLSSNEQKVEVSTLDAVVTDVKLNVFYGMPPISQDDIRKIVVQWAAINAVGLLVRPALTTSTPPAPTPGAPAHSESDLVNAVKKAVSAVADGVTIGKKGANFNLGVTGATANLKSGDKSASLGISWTGTLKLDARSGPLYFAGSLSKDKWEITLSFPQDTYIPDLSSLGKVFSEGEKAIGKMADATRSFNNISDTSKIGALIKPHAAALQNAVEAVGGIANASKKGGPSFGFKMGSPDPMPGEQGMPGGIQGQIVFTYVF